MYYELRRSSDTKGTATGQNRLYLNEDGSLTGKDTKTEKSLFLQSVQMNRHLLFLSCLLGLVYIGCGNKPGTNDLNKEIPIVENSLSTTDSGFVSENEYFSEYLERFITIPDTFLFSFTNKQILQMNDSNILDLSLEEKKVFVNFLPYPKNRFDKEPYIPLFKFRRDSVIIVAINCPRTMEIGGIFLISYNNSGMPLAAFIAAGYGGDTLQIENYMSYNELIKEEIYYDDSKSIEGRFFGKKIIESYSISEGKFNFKSLEKTVIGDKFCYENEQYFRIIECSN